MWNRTKQEGEEEGEVVNPNPDVAFDLAERQQEQNEQQSLHPRKVRKHLHPTHALHKCAPPTLELSHPLQSGAKRKNQTKDEREKEQHTSTTAREPSSNNR